MKSSMRFLLPTLALLFSSYQPAYALFDSEEKAQLLESEKNTISVFEKNVRSVVNVSNIKIARTGWWFHSEEMEVPAGAGSGFVWDDNGISNL